MTHEIAHGSSFGLLKVHLGPGELISAEAGAMVSRASAISMRTRINASRTAGFVGKLAAFFVALVRRIVGGESLMINDFDGGVSGGEVSLAPTFAGAISHKRLTDGRILLTRGCFLAAAGNLDMRMRWGGLRGLLAREGLFFMEVFGTGDLYYTSYGGTYDVDVDGAYVVDNGHLVAFDPALDFSIKSAGGGAMGFLASGEGLVCEFRGRGRLTLQSRNVQALVGWLVPRLP